MQTERSDGANTHFLIVLSFVHLPGSSNSVRDPDVLHWRAQYVAPRNERAIQKGEVSLHPARSISRAMIQVVLNQMPTSFFTKGDAPIAVAPLSIRIGRWNRAGAAARAQTTRTRAGRGVIMFGNRCPSQEKLEAFVATDKPSDRINKHLESCADCRRLSSRFVNRVPRWTKFARLRPSKLTRDNVIACEMFVGDCLSGAGWGRAA